METLVSKHRVDRAFLAGITPDMRDSIRIHLEAAISQRAQAEGYEVVSWGTMTLAPVTFRGSWGSVNTHYDYVLTAWVRQVAP